MANEIESKYMTYKAFLLWLTGISMSILFAGQGLSKALFYPKSSGIAIEKDIEYIIKSVDEIKEMLK